MGEEVELEVVLAVGLGVGVGEEVELEVVLAVGSGVRVGVGEVELDIAIDEEDVGVRGTDIEAGAGGQIILIYRGIPVDPEDDEFGV